MLKDIGAQYIIIGHSERRTYHKESDELIAKKFAVLKEQGLTPVLCIGETEAENEAGKTEEVCARQIDAVLKTQGAAAFEGVVIAYEPVWAIGTGKSATPAQAQAVHKFIRDHIAKADAKIAEQVIIQYGGSVNAANAAELFAQPDIDGALVGGASLKADAFAVIVKAAEAANRLKLLRREEPSSRCINYQYPNQCHQKAPVTPQMVRLTTLITSPVFHHSANVT